MYLCDYHINNVTYILCHEMFELNPEMMSIITSKLNFLVNFMTAVLITSHLWYP